MEYQAILFDLDGTLAHVRRFCMHSITKSVFNGLGVSVTKAQVEHFLLAEDRERIIKEEFGLDASVFWDMFWEHDYKQVAEKCLVVYEDTRAIPQIKKMGYITGIVTESPQRVMELKVEKIGKENFDHCLSVFDGEGKLHKPNPYGIFRCMEALGATPEKTLYVGDSIKDILAARNANVTDMLISRNKGGIDVKPSMKISTLYELRDMLC